MSTGNHQERITPEQREKIIADPNLSHAAKGLLLELLALPENEEIRTVNLINDKSRTRKILSILRELNKEGYYTCHKYPSTLEGGKWRWQKKVYAEPLPVELRTWKPNKRELQKQGTNTSTRHDRDTTTTNPATVRKPIIGEGTLAVTHPNVAVMAYGWNPFTVHPDSDTRLVWKCENGHLWEETPEVMVEAQKCLQCVEQQNIQIGGFKTWEPGYLYIIKGEILGEDIIQFGISNNVVQRLANHRRAGFTDNPLALLEFQLGRTARDLERVLLLLMEHHQIPSCTARGVVFDGSTEAFLMRDVSHEFLWDFMELTGLNLR